ncbi:MAG: hypothetical protein AABY15_05490 [Nanoarchaeota archaeon]
MKTMKKEKKVKVIPTQEQLNKMVMDYLKSSSKHTFQTKNVWDSEFKENYYKVIPAVIDGKQCYVAISFSVKDSKIDNVSAKVREINVTTKNQFGMMKNDVFPQYKNHKSVKQSKKVREQFKKIVNLISSGQNKSEIESNIVKILKDEN